MQKRKCRCWSEGVKFYQYQIQRVQHLLPYSFPLQMSYFEGHLGKNANKLNFAAIALLIDEAHFSRHAII